MTRYTKRQREVMKAWEDHTGFGFMEPNAGESFYDALMRNRNWFQDHTTEACSIGNDIAPPEPTGAKRKSNDR